MKNKCTPLLLLLLLAGLFSFANNGGKEKKEDPDLNGLIIAAETGKPIKDVNIVAYNNAKKEKSVISNATGNFSLADLKPGTYKFVFTKEGYEKVIREKMVLKSNEGYQLTIEMFEEENIFGLMPSPLHFNNED
jgi:hypothetical protein